MNIIDKIKTAGLKNGLTFNISGDQKTKVFYGQVLKNPYKILSVKSSESTRAFDDLCKFLIQNKKDCQYIGDLNFYRASFIEGDFKVVITQNINGKDFISFYKI
jgi:hypothetical protein